MDDTHAPIAATSIPLPKQIEMEVAGVFVRPPEDSSAERIGEDQGGPSPQFSGFMIIPGKSIKIVIATKPVDFCKGHDGLVAEGQNELRLDPHSGIIVSLPSMTEQCVGGFKTDIGFRPGQHL